MPDRIEDADPARGRVADTQAFDFTLESPSESGALFVDAAGPIRSEGASLRFAVKPPASRGLQPIEVAWRGSLPLVVREIKAVVLP